MILVKPGVKLTGLRSEILIGLILIDPVAGKFGVNVVVTSTRESKHLATRSGHYRGDGVDVRTRDLKTQDKKVAYRNAIKKKLGPDYVVILEGNHIHIHWSPIYHEERAYA